MSVSFFFVSQLLKKLCRGSCAYRQNCGFCKRTSDMAKHVVFFSLHAVLDCGSLGIGGKAGAVNLLEVSAVITCNHLTLPQVREYNLLLSFEFLLVQKSARKSYTKSSTACLINVYDNLGLLQLKANYRNVFICFHNSYQNLIICSET